MDEWMRVVDKEIGTVVSVLLLSKIHRSVTFTKADLEYVFASEKAQTFDVFIGVKGGKTLEGILGLLVKKNFIRKVESDTYSFVASFSEDSFMSGNLGVTAEVLKKLAARFRQKVMGGS